MLAQAESHRLLDRLLDLPWIVPMLQSADQLARENHNSFLEKGFTMQKPQIFALIVLVGIARSFTVSAQGDIDLPQDTQRMTPLVKVIRDIEPAVVALFFQGEKNQFTSGSGTIIHPDGYVLTNNHVVHRVEGVALYRNKPVRCVVVGRLPEKDIAVLRLLGATPPLPTVPLGHSHDVMNGESVVVSGNPGGRGIVFTSGIVSSKRAIVSAPNAFVMTQMAPSRRDDFIQFDAASNRGNSGGPLVNLDGELIGIVSALIPQEQNVSFAIPVDRVRRLLNQVMEPEVVYEKSVGLQLNTQTDQAFVTEVVPESAAARAGVQAGDVVQSAYGQSIHHAMDWTFALHRWLPSNKPLELIAKRGDQQVPMSFKPDRNPPYASVEVEGAKPGIAFDFYVGKYNELPDFDELDSDRTGVAADLDLDDIRGNREDEFAINLSGFIKVPQGGLYRLVIVSDDGSRVFLHDRMLIDHDGNHPPSPASRLVRLQEGLHPIRVEYFEGSGDQTLEMGLERFNKNPGESSKIKFFHDR